MAYDLDHKEVIGCCTIKKVSEVGYKYAVYYGRLFRRFGSIQRAREFARSKLSERFEVR